MDYENVKIVVLTKVVINITGVNNIRKKMKASMENLCNFYKFEIQNQTFFDISL